MKRRRPFFSLVSIAVIFSMLMSDISFAQDAIRDTLAPSLATKPICKVEKNDDGTFDITTNNDVIEYWENKTEDDLDAKSPFASAFREKWAIRDIGMVVAQALGLNIPSGTVKELIKKHFKNRNAENQLILEGYEIDGIKEKYCGEEISEYFVPVNRNRELAFYLKFYLNGEKKAAPFCQTKTEKGEMKNVYMDVVTIDEVQTFFEEKNSPDVRVGKRDMFFVPDFAPGVALRTAISRDLEYRCGMIKKFIEINENIGGENINAEKYKEMRDFLITGIGHILKAAENENKNDEMWEQDIQLELSEFNKNMTNKSLEGLCQGMEKKVSDRLKASIRALSILYSGLAGENHSRSADIKELTDVIKTIEMPSSFVDVVLNVDAKARNVNVNEGEMFRILENIFRNALAAQLEKAANIRDDVERAAYRAVINIDAVVDSGEVVIKIKDNGPGLPEDAEKAFREGKPFTTHTTGGGRGMRAAKYLVEKNGGKIDVLSERGEGTTFTVRLPLGEDPRVRARLLHDFANLVQGIEGETYICSEITKDPEIFESVEKSVKGCLTLRDPNLDIKKTLENIYRGMNEEVMRSMTESIGKYLADKNISTNDREELRQSFESLITLIKAVKRIAGFYSGLDTGKRLVRLNEILLSYPKRKSGQKLTTDLNAGDIEIFTDECALDQVATNLYRNALQASDANRENHISVGTSLSGDGKYVYFSIEDTGIGIPPENLRKIFEAGFTTKEDGHGFGLDIVKDLVETRLGGTIKIESEVGKGTKFMVCLPLDQEQEKPGRFSRKDVVIDLSNKADSEERLQALRAMIEERVGSRQNKIVTGQEAVREADWLSGRLWEIANCSDEWFKKSMPMHAVDVVNITKQSDNNASPELLIASMFHDADRAFDGYFVHLKDMPPYDSPLYSEYLKPILHPRMADEVIRPLLDLLGIEKNLADKVSILIRNHETGINGNSLDKDNPLVTEELITDSEKLKNADAIAVLTPFMLMVRFNEADRRGKMEEFYFEVKQKYSRCSDQGRGIIDGLIEEGKKEYENDPTWSEVYAIFLRVKDETREEVKFDIDKDIELYAFDYEETLAKTKSKMSDEMLAEIIKRLEAGRRFAVITGVNIYFLHKYFGQYIPKEIRKKYRKQIIFMGELGTEVGRYDENGELYLDEKNSVSLRPEIKTGIAGEVYKALEKHGLANISGISTRFKKDTDPAEYPAGKSIEIGLEKYGTAVVRFWDKTLRGRMKDIVEDLRDVLDKMGLKVAASNSAIDISPMDKGEALDKLRAIIKEESGKDIAYENILVGGDSQNDYAMLAKPGVKAVYFGNSKKAELPEEVAKNVYMSETKGPEGLVGLFSVGIFNNVREDRKTQENLSFDAVRSWEWERLMYEFREMFAQHRVRDFNRNLLRYRQAVEMYNAEYDQGVYEDMLHKGKGLRDDDKEMETALEQKYLEDLSKLLSCALRRDDSDNVAEYLAALIKSEKASLLSDEAKLFIRSFLTIYSMSPERGKKVGVVISMFNEQKRMGKEDFVRKKIEQMEELFAVNPGLDWEMVFVEDGEERSNGESKSSGEMALEILRSEYQNLLDSGKVKVLFLNKKIKDNIRGRKGSGIIYGLRKALDDGADYLVYTDADISSHLGQTGILLDPLVKGDAQVTIASRRINGDIVFNRSRGEKIKSMVYNIFVRLILGLKITDSQTGFKAFTREALEKSLPLKVFPPEGSDGKEFEGNFVYNFSFDTNLLCRIDDVFSDSEETVIAEVPIVWIGSREESTVRLKDVLIMLRGLFEQWRIRNRTVQIVSSDEVSQKGNYKLLAILKGDEIGKLEYSPDINDANTVWLGWIGVENKRHSVGELLMRRFFAECRAMKKNKVKLWCDKNNTSAVVFYEEISERLNIPMEINDEISNAFHLITYTIGDVYKLSGLNSGAATSEVQKVEDQGDNVFNRTGNGLIFIGGATLAGNIFLGVFAYLYLSAQKQAIVDFLYEKSRVKKWYAKPCHYLSRFFDMVLLDVARCIAILDRKETVSVKLDSAVSDEHKMTLMAYSGKEKAGTLKFSQSSHAPNTMSLEWLNVTYKKQGKGVGTALMTEFFKICYKLKKKRIILCCKKDNTGAIAFYYEMARRFNARIDKKDITINDEYYLIEYTFDDSNRAMPAFICLGGAMTFWSDVFIAGLVYLWFSAQKQAIADFLYEKSRMKKWYSSIARHLARFFDIVLLDMTQYAATRYLAKSLLMGPGLTIKPIDNGTVGALSISGTPDDDIVYVPEKYREKLAEKDIYPQRYRHVFMGMIDRLKLNDNEINELKSTLATVAGNMRIYKDPMGRIDMIIDVLKENNIDANGGSELKKQYLIVVYSIARHGKKGKVALDGVIRSFNGAGIKYQDMTEELKIQYLTAVYEIAMKGEKGKEALDGVIKSFKGERIVYKELTEELKKKYLIAVYKIAMKGEEGEKALGGVIESFKEEGIVYKELETEELKKTYLIAVYEIARKGKEGKDALDGVIGSFKGEGIVYKELTKDLKKQYLTAVYNIAMKGEGNKKTKEDGEEETVLDGVIKSFKKEGGIVYKELETEELKKQYLIAIYEIARKGQYAVENVGTIIDLLRGEGIEYKTMRRDSEKKRYLRSVYVQALKKGKEYDDEFILYVMKGFWELYSAEREPAVFESIAASGKKWREVVDAGTPRSIAKSTEWKERVKTVLNTLSDREREIAEALMETGSAEDAAIKGFDRKEIEKVMEKLRVAFADMKNKPTSSASAVLLMGGSTLAGNIFLGVFAYLYLSAQKQAIVDFLYEKSRMKKWYAGVARHLARFFDFILLDMTRYAATRYLAKSLLMGPGLTIKKTGSDGDRSGIDSGTDLRGETGTGLGSDLETSRDVVFGLGEVRLASLDDAWVIVQLKRLISEMPYGRDYRSIIYDMRERRSNDRIFVFKDNSGEVVGFIEGRFFLNAKSCYIANLAVREDMQKRGIGRILFNTFLDEMLDLGITSASVAARNDATAKFALERGLKCEEYYKGSDIQGYYVGDINKGNKVGQYFSKSPAFIFAGGSALAVNIFSGVFTYLYLSAQKQAIVDFLYEKSRMKKWYAGVARHLARFFDSILLDMTRYAATRYLAQSLLMSPGLTIRQVGSDGDRSEREIGDRSGIDSGTGLRGKPGTGLRSDLETSRESVNCGSGFLDYVKADNLESVFSYMGGLKSASNIGIDRLMSRLRSPFANINGILKEYAVQDDLAGSPEALKTLLEKIKELDEITKKAMEGVSPHEIRVNAQNAFDEQTEKYKRILYPDTGELPILLNEIQAILSKFNNEHVSELKGEIGGVLEKYDEVFGEESGIYTPISGVMHMEWWQKVAPHLLRGQENTIWKVRESFGNVAASAILAELKLAAGYKHAKFTDNDNVFNMKNATHPTMRFKSGFTPVSFKVSKSKKVTIISGLNSGGKSVTVKAAGIIALMVQAGMPVPADVEMDKMLFGGFKKAEVKDEDVSTGQGSNMLAELDETKKLMNTVKPNEFIIIDDDIFGGSSEPTVVASCFNAFMEKLGASGAVVVGITHHLDALRALKKEHPDDFNFLCVKTRPGKDGEEESEYELQEGIADSSQGLIEAIRMKWPASKLAIKYFNKLREWKNEPAVVCNNMPALKPAPLRQRGYFCSSVERDFLQLTDFSGKLRNTAVSIMGEIAGDVSGDFVEDIYANPETANSSEWREAIELLRTNPDVLDKFTSLLKENYRRWPQNIKFEERIHRYINPDSDKMTREFLRLIAFCRTSGITMLEKSAGRINSFLYGDFKSEIVKWVKACEEMIKLTEKEVGKENVKFRLGVDFIEMVNGMNRIIEKEDEFNELMTGLLFEYQFEEGSDLNKIKNLFVQSLKENHGSGYLFMQARTINNMMEEKNTGRKFIEKLQTNGLNARFLSIDKGLITRKDDRSQIMVQFCRDMSAMCTLRAMVDVDENWPFAKKGTEGEIRIKGGWHTSLEEDPNRTPNNVDISAYGKKGSLSIYTGFNTGGKSTLAKMIAQIVTHAKIGWPVPAEYASIGDFSDIQVVSELLTDIKEEQRQRNGKDEIGGALDRALHQSSMIIQNATPKSLIILDEPFSGSTEPEVAEALTAALAQSLVDRGATVILITHLLDTIPVLEGEVAGTQVFRAKTFEKDGALYPRFSFEPGIAVSSHGFEVARKIDWPGYSRALEYFNVLNKEEMQRERSPRDRSGAARAIFQEPRDSKYDGMKGREIKSAEKDRRKQLKEAEKKRLSSGEGNKNAPAILYFGASTLELNIFTGIFSYTGAVQHAEKVSHIDFRDDYGESLRRLWNFGPKGVPTEESVLRRLVVNLAYEMIVEQIRAFVKTKYPGADIDKLGVNVMLFGSSAKGLSIETSDIDFGLFIDDTELGSGIKVDPGYKSALVKIAVSALNEVIDKNGFNVKRFSVQLKRVNARANDVIIASHMLSREFGHRIFRDLANIFYINFGPIEIMRKKALQIVMNSANPEKTWENVCKWWSGYAKVIGNKHELRVSLDEIVEESLLISLPDLKTMCSIYNIEYRLPAVSVQETEKGDISITYPGKGLKVPPSDKAPAVLLMGGSTLVGNIFLGVFAYLYLSAQKDSIVDFLYEKSRMKKWYAGVARHLARFFDSILLDMTQSAATRYLANSLLMGPGLTIKPIDNEPVEAISISGKPDDGKDIVYVPEKYREKLAERDIYPQRYRQVFKGMIDRLKLNDNEINELKSTLATVAGTMCIYKDPMGRIDMIIDVLKENNIDENGGSELKKKYLIAVYMIAKKGKEGKEALDVVIGSFNGAGIKYQDMTEELKKQYLIAVYEIAMKGKEALDGVIKSFRGERIVYKELTEELKKQYLIAVYMIARKGKEGKDALDGVIELFKREGIVYKELTEELKKQYLIALYAIARKGKEGKDALDGVIRLFKEEGIEYSELTEDLKKQYLIVVYEIAMKGRYAVENVGKIIELLRGEGIEYKNMQRDAEKKNYLRAVYVQALKKGKEYDDEFILYISKYFWELSGHERKPEVLTSVTETGIKLFKMVAPETPRSIAEFMELTERVKKALGGLSDEEREIAKELMNTGSAEDAAIKGFDRKEIEKVMEKLRVAFADMRNGTRGSAPAVLLIGGSTLMKAGEAPDKEKSLVGIDPTWDKEKTIKYLESLIQKTELEEKDIEFLKTLTEFLQCKDNSLISFINQNGRLDIAANIDSINVLKYLVINFDPTVFDVSQSEEMSRRYKEIARHMSTGAYEHQLSHCQRTFEVLKELWSSLEKKGIKNTELENLVAAGRNIEADFMLLRHALGNYEYFKDGILSIWIINLARREIYRIFKFNQEALEFLRKYLNEGEQYDDRDEGEWEKYFISFAEFGLGEAAGFILDIDQWKKQGLDSYLGKSTIGDLVSLFESAVIKKAGHDFKFSSYEETDINELDTVGISITDLEYVAENLADNSCGAKDTSRPFKINLKFSNEIRNRQKYVRIEFTDTGKGMAPEVLASVRSGGGFTTKGAFGHGKGIPIVFEIIKNGGGFLEIESEEGKGTTFIIGIPITVSYGTVLGETGVTGTLPASDPETSQGGKTASAVIFAGGSTLIGNIFIALYSYLYLSVQKDAIVDFLYEKSRMKKWYSGLARHLARFFDFILLDMTQSAATRYLAKSLLMGPGLTIRPVEPDVDRSERENGDRSGIDSGTGLGSDLETSPYVPGAVPKVPSFMLSARDIFESISRMRDDITDAAMIDEIGVKEGDRILCVGIGSYCNCPVAGAIKGANVDIVQPSSYEGVEQTRELIKAIDILRQKIISKYGTDLIGERIDTESYRGMAEEVDLHNRTYTVAILPNILDDPARSKNKQSAKLRDVILNSLSDEATILISVLGGRTDEYAFAFADYARGKGYKVEVGSKYTSDNVYRVLKVTRVNAELEKEKGPEVSLERERKLKRITRLVENYFDDWAKSEWREILDILNYLGEKGSISPSQKEEIFEKIKVLVENIFSPNKIPREFFDYEGEENVAKLIDFMMNIKDEHLGSLRSLREDLVKIIPHDHMLVSSLDGLIEKVEKLFNEVESVRKEIFLSGMPSEGGPYNKAPAIFSLGASTLAGNIFLGVFTYLYLSAQKQAIVDFLYEKSRMKKWYSGLARHLARFFDSILLDMTRYAATRYLAKSLLNGPADMIRPVDGPLFPGFPDGEKGRNYQGIDVIARLQILAGGNDSEGLVRELNKIGPDRVRNLMGSGDTSRSTGFMILMAQICEILVKSGDLTRLNNEVRRIVEQKERDFARDAIVVSLERASEKQSATYSDPRRSARRDGKTSVTRRTQGEGESSSPPAAPRDDLGSGASPGDAEREEFLRKNNSAFSQMMDVLDDYHHERSITRYFLAGSMSRGTFGVPPKDMDIAVSFRLSRQAEEVDVYQRLYEEIETISKETGISFHIIPLPIGHVFNITDNSIEPTGEVLGGSYRPAMASLINPVDYRLIEISRAYRETAGADFFAQLFLKIKTYNENVPRDDDRATQGAAEKNINGSETLFPGAGPGAASLNGPEFTRKIKVRAPRFLAGWTRGRVEKAITTGLTYDEAVAWREWKLRTNKRFPSGFWQSRQTVINYTLATLDSISGFKQARESGDISTTAKLLRSELKRYNLGYKKFFVERGRMNALLDNNYDGILSEPNRVSSLIGLAVPGLIDMKNKDAISPVEVEPNYWENEENARYHILAALDNGVPGFADARARHDIKAMAGLYREYVMGYGSKTGKYDDGQVAFFCEVGELLGLISHERKYLDKKGSPAAVLRFAIPELVDQNDPDAIRLTDVERKVAVVGSDRKYEEKLMEYIIKHSVDGRSGKELYENNPMLSSQLSYEERADIYRAILSRDTLKPWEWAACAYIWCCEARDRFLASDILENPLTIEECHGDKKVNKVIHDLIFNHKFRIDSGNTETLFGVLFSSSLRVHNMPEGVGPDVVYANIQRARGLVQGESDHIMDLRAYAGSHLWFTSPAMLDLFYGADGIGGEAYANARTIIPREIFTPELMARFNEIYASCIYRIEMLNGSDLKVFDRCVENYKLSGRSVPAERKNVAQKADLIPSSADVIQDSSPQLPIARSSNEKQDFERTIVFKNQLGLHVRPSVAILNTSKYISDRLNIKISLKKVKTGVEARPLGQMALLELELYDGDEVMLRLEGGNSRMYKQVLYIMEKLLRDEDALQHPSIVAAEYFSLIDVIAGDVVYGDEQGKDEKKKKEEAVKDIFAQEKEYAERALGEVKYAQAIESLKIAYIAVETEWIEKSIGTHEQSQDINKLIIRIKHLCKEKKIEFIQGDAWEVAGRVEAIKKSSPSARGIVLAEKGAVDAVAAALEAMGLPNDQNTVLAQVKPGKFDSGAYVRLVRMLMASLVLLRDDLTGLSEEDREEFRTKYSDVGLNFLAGNRVIFNLPAAKAMDYDDLRHLYGDAIEVFA
ncbi:MAG TPA: GNAT family N-acetyltransferase [Candidatus Omnitrophota bacterium]|nr:GNAT family N-acetyltransferase [Candidatus Omnitrophota bacterium]